MNNYGQVSNERASSLRTLYKVCVKTCESPDDSTHRYRDSKALSAFSPTLLLLWINLLHNSSTTLFVANRLNLRAFLLLALVSAKALRACLELLGVL
jgi:hypothetical protein